MDWVGNVLLFLCAYFDLAYISLGLLMCSVTAALGVVAEFNVFILSMFLERWPGWPSG